VIHRWTFSWTTSPLNPLAAGGGTFDSVLNSGRSSSGAAAPGEIPGETICSAIALHIPQVKQFIVKHHSRHLDLSDRRGSFLLSWIHVVAIKLTRDLMFQYVKYRPSQNSGDNKDIGAEKLTKIADFNHNIFVLSCLTPFLSRRSR